MSIYLPIEPTIRPERGDVTSRRTAKRASVEGFDVMIVREHTHHDWGLDRLIQHLSIPMTSALTLDGYLGPGSSQILTVSQATVGAPQHATPIDQRYGPSHDDTLTFNILSFD